MLASLSNALWAISRLAFGSALRRVLAIPLLVAAVYLLIALFTFYRGTYDAPEIVDLKFEEITTPISAHAIFTEQPEVRSGLLVIDGAHDNEFDTTEIVSLVTSLADQGITVDFMGVPTGFGGFRRMTSTDRLEMLETKLRQAGGLVVISPREPYSEAEQGLVGRFVEKGGRLLLISDPTRNQQINTLAEEFGLSFQPGVLYNQVDYDLNHHNIFVQDFFADPVTDRLSQVAFYTAGAIRSGGPALAYTDGNTLSTLVEGIEPFYPLARSSQDNVLAVGVITFMTPPQNTILDNG